MKKTSTGRPMTNPIRSYFDYCEDEDYCCCNIGECKMKVKGNHAGNMQKHVMKNHPNEFTSVLREKEKIASAGSLGVKRKNTRILNVRINAEDLRNACVTLVTSNGRPFSLMEDTGFRKIVDPLLDAMNPREKFTISSESVRNNVIAAAIKTRRAIREEIKGKLISLKVDAATRHERSFLGVNIQFIKDDMIQLRTLAVKEITGRHSADKLEDMIVTILEFYGIRVTDLYSFTSDNGSNMAKLGRLLQEEQRSLYEEHDAEEEEANEDDIFHYDDSPDISLRLEDDALFIENVRCAAHTLQLAVDHVLKQTEADVLIRNVRAVVKAIRTQKTLILLRRLKPGCKKPILDVPTRWHSTVEMIQCLYDIKDIIGDLCASHPGISVSDEDWGTLKEYVDALTPAKIATKRLQEEQLVMGDFYAAWLECKLKTKDLDSRVASLLVDAMEMREKTLFQNDALLAALYLDPRYTATLTEDDRSKAKAKLIKVWLRLEKCKADDLGAAEQAEDEMDNGMETTNIEDEDEVDVVERFLKTKDIVEKSTSRVRFDISSAFCQFEKVPRPNRKDDLLLFWKNKKLVFPELYQLATIVHAAPATQVSVERLFSGMRFVFSTLRGNLTGNILDDVMVVRSNDLFTRTNPSDDRLEKKQRQHSTHNASSDCGIATSSSNEYNELYCNESMTSVGDDS